jgi:hypothetical protein
MTSEASNVTGVSAVDTQALSWEPFEGFHIPGAVRKVLKRFPDGDPSAMIFYFPPGFTVDELPYRHYHATVEELSFALGGSMPHWEYRDADQQHGEYVLRRAGLAMHRLGGSLHGLEPGADTHEGYMSLMVRTGTGNFIPETDFDEETIHVAFEPGWQPAPELRYPAVAPGSGMLVDWDDLRLVDTNAGEWEPLPGVAGASMMAVSPPRTAGPRLMKVYCPPGVSISTPTGDRSEMLAYTLWGELETAGGVLRAGSWLDVPAGAEPCPDGPGDSPIGWCAMLWLLPTS